MIYELKDELKQSSLCFLLCTYITLWENERKKTEQVTISLPRAARSFFDAEKMKNFFLITWTSEIIQFIRFEMHMDRPKLEHTISAHHTLAVLAHNVQRLQITDFDTKPKKQ